MEADFSGYATRTGVRCSDGRTILPGAFAHHDGAQVPLVWQHGHNDVKNVLGHVYLENRPDGVYAYGFFNETSSGTSARYLVKHGDIKALSIYANQLREQNGEVTHGQIREVSLVLSGANPGALIENVNLLHSDFGDDEVVIFGGVELEALAHEDAPETDGGTVKEIYDSLNEDQKAVVHIMVGAALEEANGSAEHSDGDDNDSMTHKEGTADMPKNVFEGSSVTPDGGKSLTHAQFSAILADAQKGGSLKDALLAHATTYGVENVELLFPDAKLAGDMPENVTRKMEWVNTVLSGTRKIPFARFKSMSSDLTQEAARALGYDVKGELKKEAFYTVSKRETTPTTVYTKQRMDRDDIIDIVDMDVVAWIWNNMRMMLNEEIARAILIGDGREVDDEDKINESKIRPIAHDDDFYTDKVTVAANTSGDALVEAILRARPTYRGTGLPDMYTTEAILTDMLLVKDKMGRRLYPTQAELTTALRVGAIHTVPVMESQSTDGGDMLAILVDMNDYTVGTDRGGEIARFDDFDIDYNQYKYLLEGRMSGGLTKFKTAQVISRAAGTLITLTAPTFVSSTGVVTLPSVAGVVWTMDGVVKTAGAQTAIAAGATVEVIATAATGYYFEHNIDTDWEFTRPLA